jgi:hypothetical protein
VAIDEAHNETQALPARPAQLQPSPSRRLGDLAGSKSPSGQAAPVHSTMSVGAQGGAPSTLFKAGTLSTAVIGPGGRRTLLPPTKSLYECAAKNVSNLSALLLPDVDENGEAGEGGHGKKADAVVRDAIERMRSRASARAAQEAAAKERAAAQHSEKSGMMGFYVWIDVCALAQVRAP